MTETTLKMPSGVLEVSMDFPIVIGKTTLKSISEEGNAMVVETLFEDVMGYLEST